MARLSKKRSSRELESSDPEYITFVTCRALNKNMKRKNQDISKLLSNELTEDAQVSYKRNVPETRDNISIGVAWNDDKSKPATDSKKWRCNIYTEDDGDTLG